MAVALKYIANHTAILCQETTFSPNVINYVNRLNLSGLRVIGAGASGIRVDWVRDLDLSGVTVERCGLHGILSLPTGTAGDVAYASDCRVFDGAGTREGVGLGTGGTVQRNATGWVVAGTNVAAAA